MEITTLVQALGPTGAILAVAIMVGRGVWPWLRDQYLARQVVAIEKLVAFMERSDARQAQLETNQLQTNAALSDIQMDLAALFASLALEQPSRPRRPAAQLTPKGAQRS